jgi:excisionase family DNA binding protein
VIKRLEEQLLTAKDVAGILKVSQSAVFKWGKKGIIPFYRIHRKCLRFKKTDIDAFVEDGKGGKLNYYRGRKWLP